MKGLCFITLTVNIFQSFRASELSGDFEYNGSHLNHYVI